MAICDILGLGPALAILHESAAKRGHNSFCICISIDNSFAMHFAAFLLATVHAIELHPLSPSFGLEVRGITRDDLRSEKAHKTLREAFAASRGMRLSHA